MTNVPPLELVQEPASGTRGPECSVGVVVLTAGPVGENAEGLFNELEGFFGGCHVGVFVVVVGVEKRREVIVLFTNGGGGGEGVHAEDGVPIGGGEDVE